METFLDCTVLTEQDVSLNTKVQYTGSSHAQINSYSTTTLCTQTGLNQNPPPLGWESAYEGKEGEWGRTKKGNTSKKHSNPVAAQTGFLSNDPTRKLPQKTEKRRTTNQAAASVHMSSEYQKNFGGTLTNTTSLYISNLSIHWGRSFTILTTKQ